MAKKITILCTIIVLLAGRIYAQQTMPQNSPEMTKLDYVQKVEKYRKMRGAGAVLTVVGSICAIAGVATMMNSIDESLYTTDDSDWVKGTGLALVGYGSLGAGIPLWIVGGVQHKKYNTKLQELSVKINTSPQHQGLTLTYRF